MRRRGVRPETDARPDSPLRPDPRLLLVAGGPARLDNRCYVRRLRVCTGQRFDVVSRTQHHALRVVPGISFCFCVMNSWDVLRGAGDPVERREASHGVVRRFFDDFLFSRSLGSV
jgi:hypothetical protein